MAKIIDPDLLVRSSNLANLGINGNIFFDIPNKKIYLKKYTGLDDGGVTGQAIYSYIKEEWNSDSILPGQSYPIISITDESFELINGWDFGDAITLGLIRDAGFGIVNTSGVLIKSYACIVSLGVFHSSVNDQAYYIQQAGGSPINMTLKGEVNQMVPIYADAANGNFDYRTFFKIFLREQGKTYTEYNLLIEQSIPSLTYKRYALPLSNAIDQKVTKSDVVVDAFGVTITYYNTPQVRSIGGVNRNFSIIINGNNKPKEDIYMSVQSLLRKSTDIDSGAGTMIGKIAESLLIFEGDILKTKYTSLGGVYIDGFQATDTNSIIFRDDTGTERTFPYVSSGKIICGENIVNDLDTKYFMIYTSTMDTASPIIVNDASGSPITGLVGGVIEKTFTYDYDGNTQSGPAGTDKQVVVVAIGKNKATYVKSSGTLTKSNANIIQLNASLERTYYNP